jgi:hypothetical protein
VAVERARCLLACGCDYLLFKLVRNLTSMYCDPQTTCFGAVKGDQLCFDLRLQRRLRFGCVSAGLTQLFYVGANSRALGRALDDKAQVATQGLR